MKKLWSGISGLPIHLSDDESHPDHLGHLTGVFMHPETGQITAFLVGFSRVLSPVDIEQWHKESVQISSEEAISSPNDILRLQQYGLKRSFLNTKKVKSQSGRSLGRVRDFTIDTRTASILTFEVSKRFFGIEWDKRIFSYQDISEVTEKAIILTIEPEQMERVSKTMQAPAVI